MANINFVVNDSIFDRLIQGAAYNLGYTDTVPDQIGLPIPNPETHLQFLKAKTKDYWKENLRAYEMNQALILAQNNVNNNINQDPNL